MENLQFYRSKTLLFILLLIIIIAFIFGVYLLAGKKASNMLYSNPTPNPIVTQPSPSSASSPTVSPTTNQNQGACNTDSDCQNNQTCKTVGPIIANQPVKKVCVRSGEVNPL